MKTILSWLATFHTYLFRRPEKGDGTMLNSPKGKQERVGRMMICTPSNREEIDERLCWRQLIDPCGSEGITTNR